MLAGKITLSTSNADYPVEVTDEEAEVIASKIANGLTEYLQRQYPGNKINVVLTGDTGDIGSRDGVWDADNGEAHEEVEAEIQRFLEDW